MAFYLRATEHRSPNLDKWYQRSSVIADHHYLRYQRVKLLKMFPGWTLADVDALSKQDLTDIFAVAAGENLYESKRRPPPGRSDGGGRRTVRPRRR